eukprot:TRINITY_DN1497_c0_g1_i1.p1 TRINITY_DN1497_c0_g1~~TRINITY_DN1497_c0_g1_i1.p1  ORF type:complete len:1327 (+),score=572.62 TRINITY_DN1497_c0_g1_i1:120-4100(+)
MEVFGLGGKHKDTPSRAALYPDQDLLEEALSASHQNNVPLKRRLYKHLVKSGELPSDLKPVFEQPSLGAAGAAKKPRVAIIGAGCAGLLSALLLKLRGVDVTIFEASDHVGGRLHTLDFNTPGGRTYNDAGGMRIPLQHKFVFQVMKRLNQMNDASAERRLELTRFYFYYQNRPVYFNNTLYTGEDPAHDPRVREGFPDLPPHLQHNAGDLLREAIGSITSQLTDINGDAKKSLEILKPYNDMSTRDFLLDFFLKKYKTPGPNAAKDDDEALKWAHATVSFIETCESGAGLYDYSFVETCIEDVTFGGDVNAWYRVQNGNQRFPEAFYPHLKDNIEFNHRVTAIKTTGFGANFVIHGTQGGEAWQSEQFTNVIVAVPFGVVRQWDLPAGLSPSKHRAIRDLAYSSSAKIIIPCKKRFWQDPSNPADVGGQSYTDLSVRTVVYPSSRGHPEDPVALIASYTWARDAAHWIPVSQEDALRRAKADLALLWPTDFDGTPADDKNRYFDGGALWSWDTKPEVGGGAFVTFAPGQLFELHHAARMPEYNNRVFWAGEHTDLHHAWIFGALNSGRRAAYELLRSLGRERDVNELILDWGKDNSADVTANPLKYRGFGKKARTAGQAPNVVMESVAEADPAEVAPSAPSSPAIDPAEHRAAVALRSIGIPDPAFRKTANFSANAEGFAPAFESAYPEQEEQEHAGGLVEGAVASTVGAKAASLSTKRKKMPTVAEYLKQRLQQLGLKHLFAVAGNYSVPFLNTCTDAPDPIEVIGTPNELIGGYAADGYARANAGTVGAVVTTYSVGAFVLVNAVAGSNVEHVPVIVINGAPTTKELRNQHFIGLRPIHTMSNETSNLDVFKAITVAAERITDANQAALQIDSVLTRAFTQKLPAYLEVLEDVWRAVCTQRPDTKLPIDVLPPSIGRPDEPELVRRIVDKVRTDGPPLLWAGVEVQRYGLQRELATLLDQTGWAWSTDMLGKSVLSEARQHFQGVYVPKKPQASYGVAPVPLPGPGQKLPGGGTWLLGLGVWTTDVNTGYQDLRRTGVVMAMDNTAFFESHLYQNVSLKALFSELLAKQADLATAAKAYKAQHPQQAASPVPRPVPLPAPEKALTFDLFGAVVNDWLKKQTDAYTVVADSGFVSNGAGKLHIAEENGFISQADYLSIGHAAAAAVGAKLVQPERRMLVITGDGALQETVQAISTMQYNKQASVVFVLANNVYGIEQYIVNPNPFRQPPRQYPDERFNKMFAYQDLHIWDWHALATAFGADYLEAGNVHELQEALGEIVGKPKETFVVKVVVPRDDVPADLRAKAGGPGEDEIYHPDFPPVGAY